MGIIQSGAQCHGSTARTVSQMKSTSAGLSRGWLGSWNAVVWIRSATGKTVVPNRFDQNGWRDMVPPPSGRVPIWLARNAAATRARGGGGYPREANEMLHMNARPLGWQCP